MHYFALYQRKFTGLPRQLSVGSHALVGSVTADDLEEAFRSLQAESMSDELARQIGVNLQVGHTSASVGDILIGPDGVGHMVDLIGFRPLQLGSSVARAEYALHLLSVRLEHTLGWNALFQENAGTTTAVLIERLRHDKSELTYQASRPYSHQHEGSRP